MTVDFAVGDFAKDSVYWYLEKREILPALSRSLQAEVVIVGGGMAGLVTAYHARKRGLSVVVLEKSFCGGGATGKSSGFITPDSEWEFSHLFKTHGLETAKKLWGFAVSGCDEIRRLIRTHQIECDYQDQDSLVVALSKRDYRGLVQEHQSQQQAGYKSVTYTKEELSTKLGSVGYHGGVSYSNTFGINPFAFCTGLKDVLLEMGVSIFEGTKVTGIDKKIVRTNTGHKIRGERIVVCIDRWAPDLGCMKDTVSHVQTHLAISKPLADSQIRRLFPTDNLMVWDSGVPYTYYRVTGENRLLLGGANIITTYTSEPQPVVLNKLEDYWRSHFPSVPIQLDYAWPGLIGVSKDILPVAGYSCEQPNVYAIAASSGLPWAAALGVYSIDKMIDGRSDFDTFFSADRKFPIGSLVQKVIGKKLAFMLSHGITKYL